MLLEYWCQVLGSTWHILFVMISDSSTNIAYLSILFGSYIDYTYLCSALG